MGTLSHIMLMYLTWMITSLLVGYSYEQGVYPSPQAAPLVSQRQSRVPSQQVIVPGGFQPHQLYANQFPNLRGLDHANSNGRLLQSPISIQNQQFSFIPTRGDPFARGQLPVGGNIRALAPTSASFPSPSVVKPTSSRSLSPNFVEIISPSPQRLITSNRVIGGASSGQNQASASNQQLSGNDRQSPAADVQYEYYDENDGDVLYQYGNDFNEPANNPPSSSSAGNSRQSGQFFTEVSSQQNKQLKNQRTPTSASTSSKRDSTRYAPASSTKPTQGSNQQLSSSKSVIPSGTSNRLFRPNRPSPFSSSAAASSTSAQASRETSSSFIPLIDENEEPEQGLALNGRSVQSTSHRGNSLSSAGVRPPSSFLRSSTTAAPPTPSASSSVNSSNSTNSRVRGFYSRTQQSKQGGERNSTLVSNRRPAVIRGNSNSSSNNRFGGNAATLPSRAPIIIRPRNLTRSRPNTRAKKGDPITSSSTYRPDPNLDQTGSSSEKSSIPGNSLPSVEDYTVEYVEYPFNNDDNSSVVEYYEVSEETAQALLQRAKAKAHQRKSLDHSLKQPNNKTTSTSTSSRSSSSRSTNNTNNSNTSNETATKVTVSVSAKSSYSSTSTTSTTSTTPSPPSPSGEVSSSEENTSDQVDPSGEVVISVATTKSVSGKKDVTQPPKQLATATPRVTFSRATGSSFVVASVQTSRSVGKAHGHEGRTSKTIHGTVEGLKDNMPSGAETAPEYYEEEYTYPDNYPVLNNDAGSLIRDHEDDEQQLNQDHYNPHEYSHEVSIPPSVVTPTKSVILQSSSPDYENGGVAPSSASSTGADSSSNQEASIKSVNDDEHYDDDSGSYSPHHKLPSKTGDIPLKHFETLTDDVSELEVDHPLRPVNQGDLSGSAPDDEASYHSAAILPSFPTLTTTSSPVYTTTEKPRKDPTSIFSSIRFAEVSPNFLPPGFKLPSSEASSSPELSSSSEASTTTTTTSSTTTTSTTTTEATPTQANKALGIQFQEINVASLLPKGYKPRPTVGRTTSAPTSTTEEPSSTAKLDPLAIIKNIQFKEIAIPGLIPKDYTPTQQPEKKEEKEKEPNITSSIAGIRFETPSHLLPSGFKPPVPSPLVPIKFETPSNLLPKGFKPPPAATVAVDPVEFQIPAHLLPPGYKPPSPSSTEATISSTTPPPPVTVPTTKKAGGLVFPTKSGGFRITRPTSTQPPTGDTPEPPSVRIATGWPTRKTTEFTGWPTSPTTPMPSTTPTTTTTTTERPTTTTPTTTTTTPEPKRHPAGTCAHGICRMEATIRIVGGVKWVPEFQDVNTDEYKNLETIIKRELDGAYRASRLAPYYRKVEIEGFNRGSVIVDYFLLLDGIDRDLSTDTVRGQFHKSLFDSADEPYYDEGDSDQLVSNGRLRFGRYTIDPRYTDFKVVNITKDTGSLAQEPLIPQWGIAVIVIGLASLLFVIIFGVTVLVNRHKNSKKKNAVSLTQEMLSEFNKSHMGSGAGGLDNYGADDLYNMDDVWNDKQMDKTFDRKPTKRSQGSGKGSANYNIYDSWKTEWNGYYYNGNYYGDSGYAPSRRRSDYDTNF